MVKAALSTKSPPGLVDLPAKPGEEPVKRWRISSGSISPARDRAPERPSQALARPEWLDRAAPPEPVPQPPLRPSSALDAAEERERPDLPASRDALLAGRFAHALLEHLPAILPERRAEAAALIAQGWEARLDARRRQEIAAKTLDVISQPEAAPLFSAESLAEVSLAGDIELPDGSRRAVAGRIDRLVLTQDALLIADFKTSLPTHGRARERALVQLAIYRALARDLYPGRSIRCFLFVLDGPRRLEPSEKELDAALGLIAA
jgi:ATP-dependent helicase/nuclease subunit A